MDEETTPIQINKWKLKLENYLSTLYSNKSGSFSPKQFRDYNVNWRKIYNIEIAEHLSIKHINTEDELLLLLEILEFDHKIQRVTLRKEIFSWLIMQEDIKLIMIIIEKIELFADEICECIILASTCDNVDILKLFMKHPKFPTKINETPNHPLAIALISALTETCLCGYADVVETLLQIITPPSICLLHSISALNNHGDISVVKLLLNDERLDPSEYDNCVIDMCLTIMNKIIRTEVFNMLLSHPRISKTLTKEKIKEYKIMLEQPCLSEIAMKGGMVQPISERSVCHIKHSPVIDWIDMTNMNLYSDFFPSSYLKSLYKSDKNTTSDEKDVSDDIYPGLISPDADLGNHIYQID